MIYQLVNKIIETLAIATSHIAHLCKSYNYVFAPQISMPRFNSINFYQNRPKIKLFCQKIQNFLALGAPPKKTETVPPPIAGFWLDTRL